MLWTSVSSAPRSRVSFLCSRGDAGRLCFHPFSLHMPCSAEVRLQLRLLCASSIRNPMSSHWCWVTERSGHVRSAPVQVLLLGDLGRAYEKQSREGILLEDTWEVLDRWTIVKPGKMGGCCGSFKGADGAFGRSWRRELFWGWVKDFDLMGEMGREGRWQKGYLGNKRIWGKCRKKQERLIHTRTGEKSLG